MITVTVTHDTRTVELAVQSKTVTLTHPDGTGEQRPVTAVRFTYTDGIVTAIRLITTDGPLFVDQDHLADADSWVTWVRHLADAYLPLPNTTELEALQAVRAGDTYSANSLLAGLTPQARHDLANHLDVYRTLLDRFAEAERA